MIVKDGELHITCDCHTHELHVERDTFGDYLGSIGLQGPTNWYVSFWQRGYRTDPGWKWRWNQIWNILKTGRPYGDEVVLSEAQLIELDKYIQAELNNLKKAS